VARRGPPGYLPSMTRNRLEAFSDGVIAIIITIMVLELRPPEGTGFADLAGLAPDRRIERTMRHAGGG